MDEVVFPHEFAKQVERQAVLSEKVLANHEKRIDGVRDALKNLDEVAGTAAGMAQTKDLARQAEKELAGLETSLKAVQKEMARYETLTTDAGTASMWLTGAVTGEGLSDQREKIKPILDERQKAYDAQLKLVTDIRAQLAKVSDPTKNPEAMRAIQSYTKELREQFDVLVGINKETAEQTKLRKMAEQFGFKPGTPGFAAAQKAVKDLNIAQANKALGDFADSLDEQRAAIEDVNFDANRLALEKLLKDNPQADAAARKRALDSIRDVNAAEAVAAAQEWGAGFDERMAQVNKIAGLGSRLPQAAWGSFTGIGGNSQDPANVQRESLKGVIEGVDDSNKLLEDILSELRGEERLKL